LYPAGIATSAALADVSTDSNSRVIVTCVIRSGGSPAARPPVAGDL
jgi:hypothetical protein